MKYPLALTPSLSYALDHIRSGSASAPDATRSALPRLATDLLGVALFIVILGTYATVHF